ncbi:MAG: PilN domain-containing protein [Sutterellaceae bacterium]|nr:PilN domain-containing protein [Burkholderiaceae bacterium]MDW8430111.1 PilN domain-containing protein [Sutterellaceae bacterium]
MTRIRINLLPHREAKRERQKKAFYFFTFLSLLAGLALVALVWSVLQGYIANQQGRNAFIANENRKLDMQIKEIASLRQEIEALRARQRAVEDLQADRNQPVYLLDELAKQTPEGIYLRAVKQEERKVNVQGWAASNERVSEFLRNLQNNSKYLERPELIEIKLAAQNPQGMQRRLFDFSLNFYLRPTPERAQLQGPGAGGAVPGAAPARK